MPNNSSINMSQYQNIIYITQYARFNHELGRRECWNETVTRYMNFMRYYIKENNGYYIGNEEYNTLYNAILNFEVMPSMRLLVSSGKAALENGCMGFNCSSRAIDHYKVWAEASFLLMSGCGFSYSVQRKFVDRLNEVPVNLKEIDKTIIVEDSRIGWSLCIEEFIKNLYDGYILKYDVSKLRTAGAILYTSGGRSAGPEPLVRILEGIKKIFKKAQGRKITSLEAHDICCIIAESVICGALRRSACLSLTDLHDEEMRNAKQGEWWNDNPHRSLANISAAYYERPSLLEFNNEWQSLIDSNCGERGLFSIAGIKNKMKRIGKRDTNRNFAPNPCVTGDTLLLTDNGYMNIKSLVDISVNIWNGNQWSKVIPFSTGVNKINRVTFSDGSYLDCTPYHKFIIKKGRYGSNNYKRIQTKDLNVGDRLCKFDMPIIDIDNNDPEIDAYSQGFYSGDGTNNRVRSSLYEPKYSVIPRLIGRFSEHDPINKKIYWSHGKMMRKDFVPINTSLEYKLNWIAGLLDADGCVTRDKNGNGLQLVSIDSDFLVDVKLLLTTLGIQSKIVYASSAHKTKFKSDQKEYRCKSTNRILIGNMATYGLMNLGLKTNRLVISANRPQRSAQRFVTVKSIEDLGIEEETYCVTEPINHTMCVNGIITAQCGEINLIIDNTDEQGNVLNSPGGQFCNLSCAVIRENDTKNSIIRKVELATRLGTYQTCITNYPYIDKGWKENSERENLLGVSLMGICDNKFMAGQEGITELSAFLCHLNIRAEKVNEVLSQRMNINKSKAICTLKPSGNSGELGSASSGVHCRFAEYYIRRVRLNIHDPICELLRFQEVPNEVDLMNNNTIVFSFPQKSPNGSILRRDMSALDMLELVKIYNEYYTDHNTSVTINVKDNEWDEVGKWVYSNFDSIYGLSFLPYDNSSYKQMPYEEIGEEVYNKLKSKEQDVDFSLLRHLESTDMTTGSQALACVSGNCGI
jgi:hypothetical protein